VILGRKLGELDEKYGKGDRSDTPVILQPHGQLYFKRSKQFCGLELDWDEHPSLVACLFSFA